jgi:peptidoglycan/xylan/chitin deacetylase (PgdA/CDA1 family)
VVRVVEELGYQLVLGDVYPSDPRRPGVERIVRSITERTQPGSIVILHDSSTWGDLDRGQTLAAVEEFVPVLRERGFSFVTVSELIERGAVLRPGSVDRAAGE